MERYPETLPAVEIDANGVVNVRTSAPAPRPVAESKPAAPESAPSVPRSRGLSSGVMSVLLQMQDRR